ncbi:hypothetical protein H0H92_004235 [Tricholoma furcatifolium]|nr:hypothetical protein H0H92_004235 [Tricholoma furcatifolium]
MPKANILTPSTVPNVPNTPAPKARATAPRTAKQAALNKAGKVFSYSLCPFTLTFRCLVWRGSAPTGTRKRAASPPSAQGIHKRAGSPATAQASKKVKTVAPAAARVANRKAPTAIGSESDSDDEPPIHGSTVTVAEADLDSDDNDDDYENSGEDEIDEEDSELFDDGLEKLDADDIKHTLASERPSFASTKENKATEASVSKRALARQAEVPEWVADDDTNDTVSDAPTESTLVGSVTHGSSDYDTVNSGWPVDAHYVPPQPGSRNISLIAQPQYLRAFVREAIRQSLGDALFVDAHPSPTTSNDYFRSILVDLANEDLSLRLQSDNILLEHISRILTTRVSNMRSGAKKTTAPKVESSYSIVGTVTERRDKVKKLITSGDYIYPRNHAGLMFKTKPYHHPMIISALREYFFSAARGSLASRHIARFTSSIKDGPQAKELELPIPMVCMIATATYAAIDDWNTGFLKKSEFNGDAYEDIYRGHELFLKNILAEKPLGYHRLMANLYSEVSNSQGSHSAQTVANNAMAILDLAGMEE